MKSTVGETLRKCRIAAGKSVREMSELLTANGFKASEKTIYSWENGNSQPTPDALLVMCRAYGVEDVLGTFGYAPEKPTTIAAHFDGNEFTPEQIEKIKAFAAFIKFDDQWKCYCRMPMMNRYTFMNLLT